MSYLAFRLSLIRRALAKPAGETLSYFTPYLERKARQVAGRLIAGESDGAA